MNKLYLYLSSRLYHYISYITIWILFIFGIVYMIENLFIGSLLLICSSVIFIFNKAFVPQIFRKYMPKYRGAKKIIRNINLSKICDDTKLDIYHRFLYRDLKRIFKHGTIKQLSDGHVIVEYDMHSNISYNMSNDNIVFEYSGVVNDVLSLWVEFMYKYNLVFDEDDNELAKWYIKNEILDI